MGEIVALGVRTFDVPETNKERTPTNQLRRQHRGMRRVLRRRRQRMDALRSLFKNHGLLETAEKDSLKIPGMDPWSLRAEGLERALTDAEFAVALGHIAKHRGFKSNSKRDRGENAPKESSAMLKAIASTQERLAGYRTIGEMFAKDPAFAGRKRNRDGDYSRSVLRSDQEFETRKLFSEQRRLGNTQATAGLEDEFIGIAFFQRPLGDSEDKVGDCPFEPGEKRAAKHCYSFELFRFLSRLTVLRIRQGHEDRPLTSEEIALASAQLGTHKGMSFSRLRKLIGLPDDARFNGVPPDEESKRDVVARSGSMAPGTYALVNVLGDAFKTLLSTPDKLDRIAFVLSFREDVDSIRKGLEDIGLEPIILDVLMNGVEEGKFGAFKGAAHISAKACRNIIPHLKRGLTYDKACTEADYDHAKRRETALESIGNPVARKALTEAIKQVRAIIQEYGLPGRIHIELARDVGKSKEERDEITRGIEKRNIEKDKHREEFKSVVGKEPATAEDLLRFELWKEQGCRCLYTDEAIPPAAIVSSDNTVQVDHILPWSRSGDDSFVNKTLCFAKANQEKKGRTPFEWFGADERRWAKFVECVETSKGMKGRKKRNYILKDAALLEEKFRPRNLNDTRYATRTFHGLLQRLYPETKIVARPGPLTDRLRRAWGIQNLKKGEDGKRVADDRHHALDALIVAATSEAALQRLTRAFQEAERKGLHRDFSRFEPPWPGFVEEARKKLLEVFVSRAERRRARGEANAATVRQIGKHNGEAVVFERKSVEALTLKDLERIKNPERNGKLIEILREWIEAKKPKDKPPLSPKGDPIRKVRLQTNKKVDVLIRDGAAERGEMVRVDVFRKKNKKGFWEFSLIPIYPHQIADAADWPMPPNKTVQGGKDEADWPEVSAEHEFIWSIYPLSFLEIEKSDGTSIDGYFRGLDRSTGALAVSPHFSRQVLERGIGAKTLRSFKKVVVDRLGRRFEVKRELRTWRGEVCT